MKKFLSFILATVMILSVLSACSGGGASSEVKPESSGSVDTAELGTDENADYKVSGSINIGVNVTRNSDFETLVETFKKLYPNVDVKITTFETTSDDATEYLTSLSAAKKPLPDILFDDAGSIPTYITNQWISPLNELIGEDPDFADVPQNLKDHFTYNNRIYALPQTLHFSAVILNKDLINKLNLDMPNFDWNWNDFSEFLKNCTTNEYSGVEQIASSINWISGSMSKNLTTAGYNEATGKFELSGAFSDAVKYITDIRSVHGVEAYSLRGTGGADSDYARKFSSLSSISDPYAAFKGGYVAARISGTWNYGAIESENLKFDWEYYPAPQSSQGRLPLHVDYCWLTTSVSEENKAAAWQFLRFATYSREGNLVRMTSYDEEHYSDMNQGFYIPCTTNEEVVEKFRNLPNVTEAIIYMYDNIDKSYFSDPEKTVPGFDFVYDTVLSTADDAINGKIDFNAKKSELEQKANKQIAQYREDFEKALSAFEAKYDSANS